MLVRKKHITILILVSLFMAITRTLVVIFNMETNLFSGYYLRENFQTKSFVVMTVVGIIALLVMGIYVGKGKKIIPQEKSNLVFVSSCMCAFMLFGVGIIYFVSDFSGSSVPKEALDIVQIVLTVLSAASVLYCCLKDCSKNLLALLTLVPLAWAVIRVINDFMKNNTSPLNSSGAYHILSLVFLVLYFMCVGKAYLSKGSAAIYFVFGYLAVFMLTIYALPNLIIHCLGIFAFNYQASLSAIDLVVAVYIVARMSSCDIVDLKQE